MAPRRPAGVVLFPGSGSSAGHPSLVALAEVFAPLPVKRVDFPYRRAGRPFPDRAPVLVQCVRDEVRAFAESLGVPVLDEQQFAVLLREGPATVAPVT